MTKTGQKILEKLAEALARLPPDGKERLLRRGKPWQAEKREAGQEPAMAGEEGRRGPGTKAREGYRRGEERMRNGNGRERKEGPRMTLYIHHENA